MRFRFISIVLVIAMLFSLSVPAFAAENNAIQPNDPIIVSEARSKDSYITQFDQIGDALYYYEETDEYIVAIGVLDDVTDYSIRYKNNPATIYYGVSTFEDVSNNARTTATTKEKILSIKEDLLGNKLPLQQTMTIPTSATTNTQTRSVDSDHADKFMDLLYDAGWPTSYVNYLRDSMTQNGVTANLYHSVTYSISEKSSWFAIASTALSVLMTLTSLPAGTLRLVVTLVLTASGVYVTAKDVTIAKYNVYAYGTKRVVIGNVQPYWAGRTVCWTGIAADLGATLDLEYDNKHSDYDDNTGLLETGLYNYFNSSY